MYRIGVDVGGTNTDAVVMAGREILAAVKVPTSADITLGLMQALREVQAAANRCGIAVRKMHGHQMGRSSGVMAVHPGQR